ncbi:MAG: MFS transporter, partial [Acidobacteriaceae bacterium]
MRLNGYLLRSTIVGALGGLLFGFDTAVISGTTRTLVPDFHLNAKQLGLTVSSALLGAVLGAIFSGIPGEKFGRRDSLRAMASLYVLSAIGCAFAWNLPALMIFRFLGGLGIGGSSVLGPMYISEIAPARLRGRLVGAFQINIVVGILLAYFSNYLIGLLHLGLAEWRWQLGISAVPAIFFLVMLFVIPRSPRWLSTQSRIPEAREVLE